MKSLLKNLKGKFCTFYREEDDNTNYGWTGTLIDYDRDYLKIEGADGHIRLLNKRTLDIIIEGDWAAQLEVRIDPNFKKKDEL